MQILLLDGSRETDGIIKYTRRIIEKLFKSQNYQTISFTLRELDIQPCLSCFDCWRKSAGACVRNDVGSKIVQAAAQSDLWIFFTPITYGGYSWQLKKAVDRMVPLVLPFFVKTIGETKHTIRYNNMGLIVFGSLTEKDNQSENIFTDIVYRNSLNFNNKYGISKILLSNYDEPTIREILNDTLGKAGILNEHKE